MFCKLKISTYNVGRFNYRYMNFGCIFFALDNKNELKRILWSKLVNDSLKHWPSLPNNNNNGIAHETVSSKIKYVYHNWYLLIIKTINTFLSLIKVEKMWKNKKYLYLANKKQSKERLKSDSDCKSIGIINDIWRYNIKIKNLYFKFF